MTRKRTIQCRLTDLARPTTPCFVATYAGRSGFPINPAWEATLQIEPRARNFESLEPKAF
jgi:NADPH-dependent 7-cyano-7-deazaguanine reductase QueF